MKRISFALNLLILLLFPFTIQAQIVINEFLASNVTSNPDMVDFDDFTDWIEIYNSENTSVDLSNYFLTDNISNPLKWEIPTGTTISANGYLLFWADGYNSGIGNTFMRDYWPWDNFTTKRYHTNFKLSSTGEEIGIFKIDGSIDSLIVPEQSSWKYLDDGSNQGTNWKEFSFDDSNWKTGNAQFGYGDGDENTLVSYGSNSSDKYITTYFRSEFNITNIDNIISLTFNLLRDDGAIVYLNGNEVVRSNMADGSVSYNTLATATIGGADETNFFSFTSGNNSLQIGKNILAVEIHQVNNSSSDISFDLELLATKNIAGALPQLIDSVSFGRQTADISYGRIQSTNSWAFFSDPTPAKDNLGDFSNSVQNAGNVSFNLPSGYYSNTQTISLTSSAGEIHYTLDGSKPKISSTKYSNPISITENTVVRARVFETGKIPGPITSNTYFINETISELPTASIIVDPYLFWDNTLGIYKNNLKGKEAPVSIQYFNSGNKDFEIDAGVKIGGYNIWRFAEKPLNIELNSDYGTDILNYKLFNSKSIGNFTSFEFRNGGDNWPTTMLQDAMTESIIDGHMLNGCQAYRPMIVYINGQYWGVHNLRERFDDYYFSENFDADPNQYEQLRTDLLPPDNHLGMREVVGSADDYNAMVSFAQNNNMNDPNNYNYIQSLMNTESFIDFIAGEIYVCNTSWRHNREWWRPLTGDKKWQWLLPDIDRGFNINYVSQNLLRSFISEYDLFKALLNNTNFKNRFIQKFAAHLNSTFEYNRIVGIIDSLSSKFADEMPRHIARWASEGGISSMAAWQSELLKMKNFSQQRNDIMFQNINSEFSLSGTSNLTIQINKYLSGKILINDVPLTETLTNIKVFNNIPLSLKAVPNAGFEFIQWKDFGVDNTLQLTISSDKTIIAEFAESAEHILPNKITSDLVLSLANSPFIISGAITIEPNVNLTIEAGVRLKMETDAMIIVKGGLQIKGTVEQPVIFRPNESTEAKSWTSIYFYNATDTSHFYNVTISGNVTGGNPIEQPAAINSLNSNCIFDGIYIYNVEFPIFIDGGSVSLKNSTISAYGICDYINVSIGKAVVSNNYFYGNKSPDTDAVDYDGVANGIISNNKIFNFTGFNSDGIDIGEGATGLEIFGNEIYNSRDKGISVGQKSDVHIYHNLIVGCDMGVGVKDSSKAIIENNTFYGNNIAVNSFEKNYNEGGGDVEVINCILSESKVSAINIDTYSKLTVDYSLCDTDILDGNSNLFANPSFIDRFNYNFEIDANSICIDNGNPNIKDQDGSASDIGAYYSYNASDYPDSLRKLLKSRIVVNEIMYNDNSQLNSDDWIEFYNLSNSTISLNGWKVHDEDSLHYFNFTKNLLLSPYSYFVLCKDSVAFTNTYPTVKNFIGNFDFGLSGNDQVNLINNSGELEAFVDYDNNYPWAVEPDGNGNSLELISTEMQNYTVLNWAASKTFGGTPGMKNNPTTDVNETIQIPTVYSLSQNYPNPFNPSTIISYSIPERTQVHLDVFNILGENIVELVNTVQSPGLYNVQFNASNIASGIYIYTLRTKSKMISKKMVFMK